MVDEGRPTEPESPAVDPGPDQPGPSPTGSGPGAPEGAEPIGPGLEGSGEQSAATGERAAATGPDSFTEESAGIGPAPGGTMPDPDSTMEEFEATGPGSDAPLEDVPTTPGEDLPAPESPADGPGEIDGDTPPGDRAGDLAGESADGDETQSEDVPADDGDEETVEAGFEEFTLTGGPDPEERPARPPADPVPLSTSARRLWIMALVMLGAATVVALFAVGRNVVPPTARAVGDATGWVAGGVVDLVTGAGDRWEGWTTSLRDRAADLPEQQIQQQRLLEGSESLLVVVVDDEQRAVAFVLVAVATDREATVAVIPPRLFDILPGYGDFPLSEATVFEGSDLAAVAVSNLLGVRIDDTVVLSPGGLAAAVPGPIAVDVPVPLIVAAGDGTEQVVIEAGPATLQPDEVESLLVLQGTADPLDWLRRQAAVWEGVLAAGASDATIPARIGAYAVADPAAATGALAGAGAGTPQVTVIPVTRIGLAGTESGFKLNAGEAQDFVERRLDHLLFVEGARPRIEVLNGNGRILTTRDVSAALIRRGFHVIKTDNAENFDFETTVVVAQGREHRADAERAIGVLGAGELLLELRAPSGVVDLSIIVGQDIPSGEV